MILKTAQPAVAFVATSLLKTDILKGWILTVHLFPHFITATKTVKITK